MSVTIDREYRYIDKRTWGDGPWQSEPDKIQFIDEATGLDCLLVRVKGIGHLCGYVGVPETHPLFGVSYQDLDNLEVHGGLTFSGPCVEGEEETGICHVPQPGRPDRVHWFGFDAAHAWDVRPEMEAILSRAGIPPVSRTTYPGVRETAYRTVEYMQVECAHLAAQLAQIQKETPDGPTNAPASSNPD